jgi:Protein of unknown function (DUF1569)
MKSLYEPAAVSEITHRLDALTPDTKHEWGKMNVGQMLAHCSRALEMAMGRNNPPRVLLGRLIGPLFKGQYSNERPFGRSTPTDPTLVMTGEKDFSKERTHLEEKIKEFAAGGEAGATKHPHPFFGKLTPEAWGKGMYKHLDHHLRQFGK